MLESCVSEKLIIFWNDLNDPGQINWKKAHKNKFKCTISTRIRSFYFKLFHRAIGLNDLLFKIKRKDSPNCSFCNIAPETYKHICIECPVVKPIWDAVIKVIIQKKSINHKMCQHLKKMFGFDGDKFLTHLFLLLKYDIYICKFQSKPPNFEGYKAYIASNKDLEYCIARKNNKLLINFQKWRFKI